MVWIAEFCEQSVEKGSKAHRVRKILITNAKKKCKWRIKIFRILGTVQEETNVLLN